jgi:uncharacterized membrane protein
MRNLTMLGVVLVVLGVAALLFGHFSYSQSKPVLDAGPIHVTSQQEHYVSVPTIAGIVVLVAGFGLILVGRRSA